MTTTAEGKGTTVSSTLPAWGDKWEDTKSYGSSVNLQWGSADDDDNWNSLNNSWTKKNSKGSPASAPAHSPGRKIMSTSPKMGASGGTDGPFPALLSISPKSASGGPDTGDAGATLSGQLDPFELPPTNNHIPNSESTGGKGGKKEGRFSKGGKDDGKGKGRKSYKGSNIHEKPPVVHHYPPPQLMRNVGHPVSGGTTLLIAYFPWEASETDVEAEFTRYCNVKRVHLVMDKDKDRPRCFGFVKFENKEHAEAGLKAAVEGRVCLTDSRGHIWHLKAEWAKSGDMIDDNGFYRSEEGKGAKGKGTGEEDRWGSGSWGDNWGSGSWGNEPSTRSSSKGWGKDKENSFGSGSSWGKGRESYGKDSWGKGWDESKGGKRESWSSRDNWDSGKGKKGKDGRKGGSWEENGKGRRSSYDDGTGAKGKSSSWDDGKGRTSFSSYDKGSASSSWDDKGNKGKNNSKQAKGSKNNSSFFDSSKGGGSFFESSPFDDFELDQSGLESEGNKASALEAAQKAATQLQLMQEVGRASQQMPETMAVLFQQQAANNINAQYQSGDASAMNNSNNNSGMNDGMHHSSGGSSSMRNSHFTQYATMSSVPEFTPFQIDAPSNNNMGNGTLHFNMDGTMIDGGNGNGSNMNNNMSGNNSASMSSMSNNNSNLATNNNSFVSVNDGSSNALNALFGNANTMTPMTNGGANAQQHQVVLSEASLSQLPNNVPNNTGIIIPAGLAKMLLAHLANGGSAAGYEGSPTTAVVVNGAPTMKNQDSYNFNNANDGQLGGKKSGQAWY